MPQLSCDRSRWEGGSSITISLTITWALRVEMVFYLTMFGCIAIGRRLPWPRGFAVVASGLLVLMLLLSWPIVHGKHGPDMLGFTPYFAFGGALYFASAGSRRRMAGRARRAFQ